MIPVELKLQGIYSYREEQSIDFTRLMDSGIFGIFGKTGHGKSAILEAITFALYGESERLSQKDERNYNMMNLKSNRLFIDFRFFAGKDKDEYRVTVEGKRNSKRFTDVGTYKRNAYHKQNDDWTPLDISEIANIIGLNYNNFKRTIIIPQGRFEEFLKLGASDRTKMLKEIFLLERFDLSDNVSHLYRKNEEQMRIIQGGLDQLGELDEETLNKLNIEKKKIETDTGNFKQELASLEKEEKKMAKIQEVFLEFEKEKSELAELAIQKVDRDLMQNKIEEYENCEKQFASLFEFYEKLKNEIESIGNEIEEKSKSKEILDKELSEKESVYSELKKEVSRKSEFEQEVSDLKKIIRIADLENITEKIETQLKAKNKERSERQSELDKFKELEQQLKLQRKGKKEKTKDREVLLRIAEWFRQREEFTHQEKGKTDQITSIQKEIEEIRISLSKDIIGKHKKLFINEFSIPGIKPLYEEIGKFSKMCEKKIGEMAKHREEKVIFRESGKISTNLKDGKACPVCGSLTHPDPHVQGDLFDTIEIEIEELEKQMQKETERLKTFQGIREEVREKQALNDEKERVLNTFNTEISKLAQAFEVHDKKFTWKKFENITKKEIEVLIGASDKTVLELESLEEKIEKLGEQMDAGQKAFETARSQTETLTGEQLKNRSSSETLIKEITRFNSTDILKLTKIYNAEGGENSQENSIQQKIDVLVKSIDENDKKFIQTQSEIAKLKQNSDSLGGNLTGLKERRTKVSGEFSTLDNKINARLEKTVYKTPEEVANILQWPENNNIHIAKEKKQLENYRNELYIKTAKVAELEASLKSSASLSYDENEYKKLCHIVSEKKEEYLKLQEKLGGLKKTIERFLQDKKEQKNLKIKIDQLTIREDNLKILKKMFQASGFVNFVSSVYLENLCLGANKRFRILTNNQLSLEISSKNEFIIRDHLHEGKTRKANTLSGGQAFQVSLSLALALSESVQTQNEMSQNFFFLDEGFGTLDKESLAVLYKTLQSLRAENRIVGVISHVEELQSEIDSYIEATLDPELGSRLRYSWQ
ncbi:MAG: SMC family ATPase [Leptospirales bacterium]